MTLRKILHPTDGSPSAMRALEVAARFATNRRAELLILHAELPLGADPPEARTGLDEYVATARRLLRSLSVNEPSPVDVIQARAFSAHDAIVEVAAERHADLIVMGTHGHRGLSRLLLGSNAERVLRQAPCHVLTVRADTTIPADTTFRNMLVPTDFSELSRRGLDGAMSLAAAEGATLSFVHVVEPVPAIYYAGKVTSRFELDGDLRRRIDERLRVWAGDPSGAQYIVAEGHPALEIARVAAERQIELIVMSTKGATGAGWLLVGSVTERVCRMANAPVFTMR